MMSTILIDKLSMLCLSLVCANIRDHLSTFPDDIKGCNYYPYHVRKKKQLM